MGWEVSPVPTTEKGSLRAKMGRGGCEAEGTPDNSTTAQRGGVQCPSSSSLPRPKPNGHHCAMYTEGCKALVGRPQSKACKPGPLSVLRVATPSCAAMLFVPRGSETALMLYKALAYAGLQSSSRVTGQQRTAHLGSHYSRYGHLSTSPLPPSQSV